MEKFTINYSQKNIPIPSKHQYILSLMSKVERVINRMRWKVLEFQGNLDDNKKNMYSFKSLKCPPPVNEVKNFENELLLMVKNIEFKNVKN